MLSAASSSSAPSCSFEKRLEDAAPMRFRPDDRAVAARGCTLNIVVRRAVDASEPMKAKRIAVHKERVPFF